MLSLGESIDDATSKPQNLHVSNADQTLSPKRTMNDNSPPITTAQPVLNKDKSCTILNITIHVTPPLPSETLPTKLMETEHQYGPSRVSAKAMLVEKLKVVETKSQYGPSEESTKAVLPKNVESVNITILPNQGPSITQLIELPYKQVCASRIPHDLPEANYSIWPNPNSFLTSLLGPSSTSQVETQQLLASKKERPNLITILSLRPTPLAFHS